MPKFVYQDIKRPISLVCWGMFSCKTKCGIPTNSMFLQLSDCLERAETSVVLVVSNFVLYHVHVYTVIVFTIALHESGTRKAMSWSVTVYNKQLSNQCNLTAQIAPEQDIFYYVKNYNRQHNKVSLI